MKEVKEPPEGMHAAFRIAIRREGPWINAYWAKTDTMEDSIHIGSLNRRMCDMDTKLFDAFVLLMKAGADVVSREMFGDGVAHFTEERVLPKDHDK